MLLSGGIVLGDAIQKSELLHLIASLISNEISGSTPWVIFMTFATLTWFSANFISHTVASIIILPVIASVGCSLGGVDGCKAGHFRRLVMGSALIDSGSMALPVTSFPNAQAFSEKDADGKNFLRTSDFLKTGFLIGVIELVILGTMGYFIIKGIVG